MFPTAESRHKHQEALDRIPTGQQPRKGLNITSIARLADEIEEAAKRDYESGSESYEDCFYISLGTLTDFELRDGTKSNEENCYAFEINLKWRLAQHLDTTQVEHIVYSTYEDGVCKVSVRIFSKWTNSSNRK